MRHKKKINHLSRTSTHRKAMLANMASSLILHKRITTTLAKAKALRVYVEPLITRSKDDNTHSRRMVFRHLQNKVAVTELFREVSLKVADRPGGYTRIIKLGNRLGDNAEMCMMELVDFNENLLAEKVAKKTKSRRRRRSTATKSDSQPTPAARKAQKTVEVEEKSKTLEDQVPEEETLDMSGGEKVDAPTDAVEEKPVSQIEEDAADKSVSEESKEAVPEASKKETEMPTEKTVDNPEAISENTPEDAVDPEDKTKERKEDT